MAGTLQKTRRTRGKVFMCLFVVVSMCPTLVNCVTSSCRCSQRFFAGVHCLNLRCLVCINRCFVPHRRCWSAAGPFFIELSERTDSCAEFSLENEVWLWLTSIGEAGFVSFDQLEITWGRHEVVKNRAVDVSVANTALPKFFFLLCLFLQKML